MSRRITFPAAEHGGRKKAIQPEEDDLIRRFLESELSGSESQIDNDHEVMTVIRVTVTKEVYRTGETESSRVDHRSASLVIYEHLPQIKAEKEAATGDEATGPNESDQRLGKLILDRIDKLVFDSFLVELTKELGKHTARLLVSLTPILITLVFLYILKTLWGAILLSLIDWIF